MTTSYISFTRRDEKSPEGRQHVQDGHVREEEADEQRADRGGYHSAIDAPRRRLLEDTRSASARREQVTACNIHVSFKLR